MSYWLREIAGWVVLLLGIVVFFMTYGLLLERRVFEAGPLAFIGFVLFRGGIHLLKVALAARMAYQSPEIATTTPSSSTGRRSLPASKPRVVATDARSVMPGRPL